MIHNIKITDEALIYVGENEIYIIILLTVLLIVRNLSNTLINIWDDLYNFETFRIPIFKTNRSEKSSISSLTCDTRWSKIRKLNLTLVLA
jgi:hypothetical protein